jgi:hypothetical protein
LCYYSREICEYIQDEKDRENEEENEEENALVNLVKTI